MGQQRRIPQHESRRQKAAADVGPWRSQHAHTYRGQAKARAQERLGSKRRSGQGCRDSRLANKQLQEHLELLHSASRLESLRVSRGQEEERSGQPVVRRYGRCRAGARSTEQEEQQEREEREKVQERQKGEEEQEEQEGGSLR